MTDKENKNMGLFSHLDPRERAIVIILAVLALTSLFSALFLFPKNKDMPVPGFELEFGINVNDSLRFCPDTVLMREIGLVTAADLCNPSANRSLYGNFWIDPDGCLIFRSFGQVGQDSLCIQVRNERKELFHLLYKITVERRIEEDTSGLLISVEIPEPGEEEQKPEEAKMEKGETGIPVEKMRKVEQPAYCGSVKYTQWPLSNKTTRPALEDSKGFAIREVKAVVLYDPSSNLAGRNARKSRETLDGLSNSFAPHFIVDDREILEVVPEKEVARHLSGRAYLPPAEEIREGELSPNYFSLGVMMAVTNDGKFDKLYSNTVRLLACLLDKYRLTTEDLYRNYDMTGKNDPLFLLSEKEWGLFKKAVKDRMDKESKIKG